MTSNMTILQSILVMSAFLLAIAFLPVPYLYDYWPMFRFRLKVNICQ